jgi:hypothetical protein
MRYSIWNCTDIDALVVAMDILNNSYGTRRVQKSIILFSDFESPTANQEHAQHIVGWLGTTDTLLKVMYVAASLLSLEQC